MLYGAIEAGGTKIICAVGNEQGEVFNLIRLDTLTPDVTMPKIIEYFKENQVESIGIGTFGPAGVNPDAANFGYILDTPKLPWAHFNFLGALKEHFDIPMNFDTDVNGAALAEHQWGAAQNVNSCIYITVGTGIGGGAFVNGKLLHGLLHPEMGHFLIPRHPQDQFEGVCPFHGNCLEGMASGPSIEKRWGQKAYLLDAAHPAWEMEAYYLAQGVLTYIMILSPERIILGGGVMGQKHLLDMVRKNVQELLKEYIKVPQLEGDIDQYIVSPQLGENAGTYGALALALQALNKL
ncbi:MAG: fructokinase [Firmicutes bacterium HGW-Firmicutes-1]|jgi:fructokinase|nr:MAG: fructokinase [Firmicutes bacterium HGW-Firmicutes-1]